MQTKLVIYNMFLINIMLKIKANIKVKIIIEITSHLLKPLYSILIILTVKHQILTYIRSIHIFNAKIKPNNSILSHLKDSLTYTILNKIN